MMFFNLFLLCCILEQKYACSYDMSNSNDMGNEFHEELVIKPLPYGHIYSNFEFTTLWTNQKINHAIENYNHYEFTHYDYFPRAFGEIIEKYCVRELHLSLTQGLWIYEKWGYPLREAAPGAQLWVWFTNDVENVDEMWKSLADALSGLLCASLNFIDSTNTISPELSFRPLGIADEWYSRNSSLLRYAALPRENVCTENLTPWKKLLPCDSKSGLSTLLHATPLYSAHFHSLSLHLKPTCTDASCETSVLELVQSLDLVQKMAHEMEGKQDWTVRRLYGSVIGSACPLASTSAVYVDVTNNEDFGQFTLDPAPTSTEVIGVRSGRRVFAAYDVASLTRHDAFNVQARYKKKIVFGVVPPPQLLISRYIAGNGQEKGSINVKITNSGPVPLAVVYLETLPWYLRLFFHPSQSYSQVNKLNVTKLVTARDRERGWLYEAVLRVEPRSSVTLQLDFARALLKWLEYPPDANHGFYVPSAVFSATLSSAHNMSLNRIRTERWRTTVDGPAFVRVVSEVLLVSLPTPDFSMPYNVICLACTVVALAFGPIHNITTKSLTMKKNESKSFLGAALWQKLKSKFGRQTQVETSGSSELKQEL